MAQQELIEPVPGAELVLSGILPCPHQIPQGFMRGVGAAGPRLRRSPPSPIARRDILNKEKEV